MSNDGLNLDEVKTLTKINPKYQCMVSGEKRMEPCAGCSNPKGCVSRTMQYKENEVEEKAVVKIDADGEIVKCAKGLAGGECGYKGGKVCAACGAMAVQMKSDDDDAPLSIDAYLADDIEEKGGFGAMRKPGKQSIMERMAAMADDEEEKAEMGDDGEMDDEEDTPDVEENPAADAAEDAAEGEEDDEEEKVAAPEAMEDDDEMDEDTQAMVEQRKKMRRAKLMGMGYKSEEIDDEAFMCAFERKVYGGGNGVCASCPGGCAAEGSLPGLLDIEAIAEDTFAGKVLDSGYSDEADLYVVDLERKDGKPIEIFFDGETAECLGWHLLDESVMNSKSAFIQEGELIDFNEAAGIATKTIQGDVISVEADVFEGFDAYAVEVEGLDGKSYDVFVSLDGEVLGYDEYTLEEAEDIEAEAAEIALKRAFSEDEREKLAKRGHAMPDGSFPIVTEDDLQNAIQAYGRAKDKNAAKAHIIKRALDLGKEEMIPLNWAPKKMRDEYEGGKKSDDAEKLIASLMEFEMLAAEEEMRSIINDPSL